MKAGALCVCRVVCVSMRVQGVSGGRRGVRRSSIVEAGSNAALRAVRSGLPSKPPDGAPGPWVRVAGDRAAPCRSTHRVGAVAADADVCM